MYITNEPRADAAAQQDAAASTVLATPETTTALPRVDSIVVQPRATCPRRHCWRSGLVPPPTHVEPQAKSAREPTAADTPIAVWQEHMGPDSKLDFPRAKGLGLVGVVLRGVLTLAPSEGGSLAAMQPWGVFVAPGAGVTLTATQPGADVLLAAYAFAPPLAQKLEALRRNEKGAYWEQRPHKLVVEDLQRMRVSSDPTSASFELDAPPHVRVAVLLVRAGQSLAAPTTNSAMTAQAIVSLAGTGEVSLLTQGRAQSERPESIDPGGVLQPASDRTARIHASGSKPLVLLWLRTRAGPLDSP